MDATPRDEVELQLERETAAVAALEARVAEREAAEAKVLRELTAERATLAARVQEAERLEKQFAGRISRAQQLREALVKRPARFEAFGAGDRLLVSLWAAVALSLALFLALSASLLILRGQLLRGAATAAVTLAAGWVVGHLLRSLRRE